MDPWCEGVRLGLLGLRDEGWVWTPVFEGGKSSAQVRWLCRSSGVTLVSRPRGSVGGALCLFFAGTGLLIGIFLLLWCLYRRASRHRSFAHHRLRDSGDEPGECLLARERPYPGLTGDLEHPSKEHTPLSKVSIRLTPPWSGPSPLHLKLFLFLLPL